ncbi:MAG TPA: iron-containing alcohol dehydrogenase [Candidatus Kapabacteria bacterium]|nr:iron-containing alcohol dehydrogenase [Candidatus Kapabacteria bacterium]HPO63805.1 iron-containing alcohol dehydrogenase [Candidatus Kapabacteria bacterium]
MQNFIFHNPTKIIFGKGTINQIGIEIKNNNLNKVLLLAGSGSIKRNGVYEQAVNSLKENNIEWFELWDVQSNPTLEHTNRAIAIARDLGLKGIVAIGGGSVIDEAKAIAAGIFVDNIWDAYLGKISITQAIPIFTILTISATGSEMNIHSVISNEESKKKLPLSNQVLRPLVSIIDPSIQATLPWAQTVYGAIDILSHVMESYFVGQNQEVTLALDESLMRTVIKCVDLLQNNEKDYDARASLAWAATLALNGIASSGIGGDWACHRIEHSLSAIHTNIAHGAGLGIIFPAWIKYVHNENPETFNRWAKNVWDAASLEEALDLFQKKLMEWKAPTRLSEIGIQFEELDLISKNAFETPTLGVVKKIYPKDVLEILKLAF